MGFILQKRQIADDAGKRRFEIVGQVDNQVVFPLLGILCGSGIPQSPLPNQVQLILRVCQSVGQHDGAFVGVSQLLGCRGHQIQIPEGSGDEAVGDPGPSQQDGSG